MIPSTDDYLAAEVLTAGPYRLHQIVVDAAVRFAGQAESAAEAGDWEIAALAVTRSREFVAELLGGLKAEAAPELAERIKALFVFAYRNLAEAETARDATKIGAALQVLRTHQETWRELGSRLAAATTPTNSPGPSGGPSTGDSGGSRLNRSA